MKPLAVLLAAAISLPLPALASRALPSWSAYHGDRETALSWRAIAEQRTADAVEHAERATALAPSSSGAWHALARAQIAAGSWEGAADAVAALRRLAPDDVQALELMGRVAVELGRRDDAVDAFTALDGLQHDLAGPRVGLALVAARLDGDVPAAIAHLRMARERDAGLDLSGLLLRPHWKPLADDPVLIEALTELLQSE